MGLDAAVAANSTPEKERIHRELVDHVLGQFRAAFKATDTNQTTALEAAGISNEAWRQWGLDQSPTLRSLVALAKVLEHRVMVHLVQVSGVRGTTDLVALDRESPNRSGGREGSMNNNRDDWDDLTEEERRTVRVFIQGMRNAPPHPQKPSPGKRPDQARKAHK